MEDAFLEGGNYTAWRLIKGFWQSKYRLQAFGFTGLVILLTMLLVGCEVIFNYWNNYFYNALQAYQVHKTIELLVIFVVIASFNIILQVYRYYVAQMLNLRWRNWLTKKFISRWLERRGYYYLEVFDKTTDNPDQRLQEDIQALVTTSIDLTTGLIAAVTTIPAFIYILWTLSGTMAIPLGSWGTFHIQGYLVWVSLIYSAIGTFLTFKIGAPLVPLNYEQQRREANFRYAAIDLRNHSEHVALYRGENHQGFILRDLFVKALENYYRIVMRQKKLTWFTGGFNQIAILLPLAAVLPNYFGKVFLLGGLIQALRAFNSIQESFSYLINAFNTIAQWRAIARRLTNFINHLHDSEVNAAHANHLKTQLEKTDNISVKGVSIDTPRKEKLLENVNLNFEQGQNYVIQGHSGLGKSTFIRAIAQVWPYAAGEMTLPADKKQMFLPQKPYMPIGTLAEAIVFPDKDGAHSYNDIEEVLRECNLAHLIPHLKEHAIWAEQLSPGELQRIAFARVLLQKPDWVFLDESTSMLDLKNEMHLYKTIRKRLPHCSIVSIGHRPSLDALHDHKINMEKFQAESSR